MMRNRFLSLLGPGLMYAGAAIGVSHLVQSTRAGAEFCFELMWILLAANLLKFPFFEIGSRYTLATGKNLIDAYFEKSKWILILFVILTVVTMFPVQSALTLVTAGLANNIFNTGISSALMSTLLVVLTMIILMVGRFKMLDRLIKVVIILLTFSTIIAVIGALNIHTEQQFTGNEFNWLNKTHILFLIAFIGWMPAPIDIVVWTSIWSQTKFKSLDEKPELKDVLIEFRTGYFGTMIVAAAFLALGALVMHGSKEELSSSGAVFAGQLIGMYTHTIGQWAYPIIALAALTTMLSTTLTVSDAYPRTLQQAIHLLLPNTSKYSQQSLYIILLILLSGGVILLIFFSGSSMRSMVDVATSLSFVTAPILAYLNYKVIMAPSIPKHYQPNIYLKIWSWVGIIFLTAFTLFYLYWLMN